MVKLQIKKMTYLTKKVKETMIYLGHYQCDHWSNLDKNRKLIFFLLFVRFNF